MMVCAVLQFCKPTESKGFLKLLIIGDVYNGDFLKTVFIFFGKVLLKKFNYFLLSKVYFSLLSVKLSANLHLSVIS